MPTKGKKKAGGRPKTNADELLAVALASGMPVMEAASKFSLSPATVRRRIKTPAFAAKLRDLRAEMSAQAVGQTAALLEEAGARLKKLVASKNEVVALGAVREVYASFLKMSDYVELSERLARVEAALGLKDEKAKAPPEAGPEDEPEGA